MGKNETSLTLKIPPEIHRKLRIMAAVNGRSMTSELVDLITNAKMKMPVFDDLLQKEDKPAKKTEVSKEEIKKMLLSWKDQGVTYSAMAEKLKSAGYSTFSGRGIWDKTNVANVFRNMTGKATRSTQSDEKGKSDTP